MSSKRVPYYPPNPSTEWPVHRCTVCGQRRRMRDTDEVCGACAQGEPPRLQQSVKPALDTLVRTITAQYGRLEIEYLYESLGRQLDKMRRHP